MRSAAKQGRCSRHGGLVGHRRRVGVAGAYDSHRYIMSPDAAAFACESTTHCDQRSVAKSYKRDVISCAARREIANCCNLPMFGRRIVRNDVLGISRRVSRAPALSWT